jgi:hypothetical protein
MRANIHKIQIKYQSVYRIREVILDLFVPREGPEGRIGSVEGGVVKSIAISSRVAHPDIETCIRKHISTN